MQRIIITLITVVAVILCGGAVFLYVDGRNAEGGWLYRFRLQKVSVEGVKNTPEDELRKAIPQEPLPYIWTVSVARLKNSLEHLPWVAAAEIEKSWYPPALEIAVVEEEPLLVADLQSHSWLVSRSGILLQPLEVIKAADLVMEVSTLPRLVGLDSRKGESDDEVFRAAIRLISDVDSFGGVPFVVEQYEVLPGDGVKIIPSDELNIPSVMIASSNRAETEQKVRALSKVFADLRHRGEKALSLDLRFSGQVVVKKVEDEIVAEPAENAR